MVNTIIIFILATGWPFLIILSILIVKRGISCHRKLKDTALGKLVIPTMVMLEVYKHIRRHKGRDEALQAVAGMKQGEVQDLDERLALYAGELGVEVGLPLADSVILATSRLREATLWTQDSDFEGMEGVRFKRKRS